MKIHSNTPDTVISNVQSHGEFRIKNSAKAFDILSSGLYSNKIKAIVRELSCNALDSHKEAGKLDIPFDVHLPNAYEPYFSVRDYGIGLDHEGVTQIYTTYFESTKQDSNDYIGALGLGSKSPFSYTNNFSVIAIKDGIRRIYTAFINDLGCPEIALMQESRVEDMFNGAEDGTVDALELSNGVEVKFSVTSNSDFYRFADEATTIFKWFEHKPNVTGNSSFMFEHISYKEKDIAPGVHLMSRGSAITAIQGNIAYPVELPDDERYNHVYELLFCPLVIHFEIGELDVSASREKLSYVHWTVENIIKRLESLSDSLDKYVESQIKDITCEWLLASRLNELYLASRLFKPTITKMVNNNRCSLIQMNQYNNALAPREKTLCISNKELAGRGIKLKIVEVERTWQGVITREVKPSTQNSHSSTGLKSDVYYNFPHTANFAFMINDTTKGAMSRIRYHYKQVGMHNAAGRLMIYLLDIADKENEEKILNKFYKRLKNPPVPKLLVSVLEEKDKLKSVKANLLKLVTKQKSTYYSWKEYWAWDKVPNAKIDPSKTYYYLPLSNYTVLQKDEHNTNGNFLTNIWPKLQVAGMCKGIEVYGVRKSFIDIVKSESNWVSLYDLIDSEIKKITGTMLLAYAARGLLHDGFINKYVAEFTHLLDAESEFGKFFDTVKLSLSLKDTDEKLAAIQALLSGLKLDIGVDIAAEKARVESECTRMTMLYPMLQYIGISQCTDSDEAQVLINYIQLVDNTRRESAI